MGFRLLNRHRIDGLLRSGGFTLMFVLGPGRQTRRVHVPRWAVAALCVAWLGAMAGAGLVGFYSAQQDATRVAGAQGGARMATAPWPRSRQ